MLSYRPNFEVNDFYDSIQALQDNCENTGDFGKFVPEVSYSSNIKKTYSYSSLNGPSYLNEPAKKSFSTNSFAEKEYEFHGFYPGSTMQYQLEDHSTMASLSSTNSFTSPPSFQSVTKAPYRSKGAKAKCKGSGGKKKNNEQDYRKKYKTEFCKYWSEKGFCEFGSQCAFAHGNDEVRQKQYVSSNYKTKKCMQFHEVGYCPYGIRCQFIHCFMKDTAIKENLQQLSYNEAFENAELWINHDEYCSCLQSKMRPRLPFLKNLAESGDCHSQ